MCDYFALCAAASEGIVRNPIVGDVPTCSSCAAKMEQELHPLPVTRDLYRDAEVVIEQIDTTDLETTTCSTCGVDVVELDGIWYHAEAPGPIPEHLARPSKLTNGG